jgi:N-terminal acetyltransferase B complex catalytic subunit
MDFFFSMAWGSDRRVLGYNSGEFLEDANDMRKALPRDKDKQSIIPLDHPVYPEDLEW